MKNFSFAAIIIAIVAPIVKLFPSWALKYTKRTNRFAQKFQLSAIKEENYFLKHPQSAEWVAERIWHWQTRKYFFKLKNTRPELFEVFIKDIPNSVIFDAAYEIVPEEAIKAKGYTLDADRVVKACNDNVNYLYILAEKQPQSFTAEVVRRLGKNRQEAYFSYLFSKCRWDKLAEFDVLLFDQYEKDQTATDCLSFLLNLKEYKPNISAKQLSALGDRFENWCANANPLVVAKKMADYWGKNQNYEAIYKILQRTLPVEFGGYDTSNELLDLLEESEYYPKAINDFLEQGIACPTSFKYLLDNGQTDNIEKNISLCIQQGVIGKIYESSFDRLDNKQQKDVLIALAQSGKLSNKMLNKAPNSSVKEQLLSILEENAQAKWFKPLMGCYIQQESVEILENYFKKGRIYPALQDLTFKDNNWVKIFVEKNWYDEQHKLKLMQSVFIDNIRIFMHKYGLTQAQFEALLTGTNANLAPEAKLYLKKEKDADFEDGI